MTQDNNAPRPADAELVAYLDGELPPVDAVRMGQRIAANADLKRRLDQLLAGGRPFREAFGPLLDAAPQAQLDAMLANAIRRARPVSRVWEPGGALRLAAAAVALLAIGAGFDHLAGSRLGFPVVAARNEGDEWRGAVADYLALYTRDTLARIPVQAGVSGRDVSQAGDRIGIPTLNDKVALGDLALKRADVYDYDGKPLVFLAYLGPQQGPVALCIIEGGEPTEPRVERRQDMNVVYWSDRGHSFMLVGHTTADQLQKLATGVKARFAGDPVRAG